MRALVCGSFGLSSFQFSDVTAASTLLSLEWLITNGLPGCSRVLDGFTLSHCELH